MLKVFNLEQSFHGMSFKCIMVPAQPSVEHEMPTAVECRGKVGKTDTCAMPMFAHHLLNEKHLYANVTELDLSNLFGEEGDIHFQLFVSRAFLYEDAFTQKNIFPSLVSFKARANHLSDSSLVLLLSIRHWPKHLQFLDLSKNLLTDSGLFFISEFLATTRAVNLHTLVLANNRFHSAFDYLTVRMHFAKSTSLQRLDFRGCRFERHAVESFIEVLTTNTALQVCLFDPTLVNNALVGVCRRFFETNKTLGHLSMPGSMLLKPFELTNYLVQPGLQRNSFDRIINRDIHNAAHFAKSLSKGAMQKFVLGDATCFHTLHPFYTMIMTVLVCNGALRVRIPDHLLFFIFTFLFPKTFALSRGVLFL